PRGSRHGRELSRPARLLKQNWTTERARLCRRSRAWLRRLQNKGRDLRPRACFNPAILVLRRPEGTSKDDPGAAGDVANRTLEQASRPFCFRKMRLRMRRMPFEQTLSEGEAANQRRPMRAANGLERPRGIRSASRFPDPEGPMKRPARKTQKPQSQKRSASKRGAKAPAVRFGGAELDFIREILTSGVWEEDEERDSLEDMIDELLTAEPGDERGDLPELLEDIADALQDARLDADGGDADARETLRNVRAMIDRAADRDTINPRVLLFLGRLFAK